MTFVSALWFCAGTLAGGGAVLLLAGASVGMQRDREGRLLQSLKELREYFADQQTCPHEMECALARADLAIAYSMEAQS